ALSHLGLPRSPCRRSGEGCEGRGPSGAPGPSPSRHRADPGSRESQCCLTIETSGQPWSSTRCLYQKCVLLNSAPILRILLPRSREGNEECQIIFHCHCLMALA